MVHNLLRVLAIFTSIGAYLMLLMGAIVTKTGSGEGCGASWPFCHGQLIPESMPIETVLEYSHRIVSSIDGFLILVLTIGSWLVYRKDTRVKLYGFMSLFFVILQGMLGALTVLFAHTFAKDPLLSLHFGFSLISFASVILLTVHLFEMKHDEQKRHTSMYPVSRRAKYAIWGVAAYTYLVVYTGALVRHTGATLGCGTEIPGCGATIFPNFTTGAGIHMLHRYAAASLWLVIFILLIMVVRFYRHRQDLYRGAILAFILITLQAISGAITVWTSGLLMMALLHTTIISIFFAVLCYLCGRVGAPWKSNEEAFTETVVDKEPVVAG